MAITAAACASGPAIALLTATPHDQIDGLGSCYMSGITGDLEADLVFGTAVVETVHLQGGSQKQASWPVKWPLGYTGRQSGSAIEVLDGSGRVVARTGTKVELAGGYENGDWAACARGIQTLP